MVKHHALIYRTEDEFVSALVPFVLAGVDSGEAVFAAASPESLDALRSGIGATSSEVHFVDAADWYVKPAQTLGTYLSFIDEQLRDRHTAVRIIGEVVWPTRDVGLRREWTRYESAINAVFANLPAWVICPYNAGRLTASTIAAARATHTSVIQDGLVSASGPYVPPELLLTDLTVRLPLPMHRAERRFDASDVVGATVFVVDHALRAGLTEVTLSNVAAAASEIMVEAAAHTRAPVLVAAWTDGADYVCQIENETSTPTDPLAGYGPPTSQAPRGWGLWLARQLSDLLEVGVGSLGTAVRLRMREADALPPSG